MGWMKRRLLRKRKAQRAYKDSTMILPGQTIGLLNVHLMVTVGYCGYEERPNGTPNITTQSVLASFIQFVLNLGHCTVNKGV